MTNAKKTAIVKAGMIESRILLMRGERAMIDSDLAALYGVTTKALNQAVKRNSVRFPSEFVFQLTANEKAEVVTVCDHLIRLRFSPNLPFAFTEHGAIMVASVLNTARAIEVSIMIVRTFVKLREMLSTSRELQRRLQQLEQKLSSHDQAIVSLVTAIRKLAEPSNTRKRRIGFRAEKVVR